MLIWHDTAWADYTYWQVQDKKILKRINMLIKDIERNGNEGIGKPEPLKGNLSGFWSRRIDDRHRLVYCIVGKNRRYPDSPMQRSLRGRIARRLSSLSGNAPKHPGASSIFWGIHGGI